MQRNSCKNSINNTLKPLDTSELKSSSNHTRTLQKLNHQKGYLVGKMADLIRITLNGSKENGEVKCETEENGNKTQTTICSWGHKPWRGGDVMVSSFFSYFTYLNQWNRIRGSLDTSVSLKTHLIKRRLDNGWHYRSWGRDDITRAGGMGETVRWLGVQGTKKKWGYRYIAVW